MTRLTIAAVMCLFLASTALAQTVINPTLIEFQVSADHNTVVTGVGALVERYEVRWYAAGATAPQQTSDLGKPTPDTAGKASVDISATIIAFPISPTTQYVAKMIASGVAGPSAESAASNPFLRVAPPRAVGAVTLVRP